MHMWLGKARNWYQARENEKKFESDLKTDVKIIYGKQYIN